MKTTSNITSYSIYILSALQSKVGFYRKRLVGQIVESDPKNPIVTKEIQLIIKIEKSLRNCLNEVGLDQQYNLKQPGKLKSSFIFGGTFLDVFLLQSPDLSNSLRLGSPHCGSALQLHTSYLLYILCSNIYLDGLTSNCIIPIEADEEWMICLAQFNKSTKVPLSLLAALGIAISEQHSDTKNNHVNFTKYPHND